MTEEAIDPIDHTKLAEVATNWRELLEDAKDLPCDTPEREAWWAGWLANAQKVLNELEEERKQLNRPMLESTRRVNATFAAASEPLEAFKALVKQKLEAAAQARMLAQDAARQAAFEAEDGETCAAALAAIPEDVRIPGVSPSYDYEFKVVDPSLVPEVFKVVDESLVKDAIRAAKKQGMEPQIPGITFTKVAKVKSSGRKK